MSAMDAEAKRKMIEGLFPEFPSSSDEENKKEKKKEAPAEKKIAKYPPGWRARKNGGRRSEKCRKERCDVLREG